MLQPGTTAPPIPLADIDTGEERAEPWVEGPTVVGFFKVTCPVCQMAAPAVEALAEGGALVVAVGEDPPKKLNHYRVEFGQDVATRSEPPPYPVSTAYGVESVPTLFLVGIDGVIVDAVAGWNRDRWNSLAERAGARPVSSPDDGLPPFRSG